MTNIKRSSVRTTGTSGKAAREARGRGPVARIQSPLDPEQRRRMAECCAFFNAERYREAGPGTLRETDVRAAEAQIESVLRDSDQ